MHTAIVGSMLLWVLAYEREIADLVPRPLPLPSHGSDSTVDSADVLQCGSTIHALSDDADRKFAKSFLAISNHNSVRSVVPMGVGNATVPCTPICIRPDDTMSESSLGAQTSNASDVTTPMPVCDAAATIGAFKAAFHGMSARKKRRV